MREELLPPEVVEPAVPEVVESAALELVEEEPTGLTIRVWMRDQPCRTRDCSCSGEVIELPIEEYVAGVLPSEWYGSWHDESLKAGAIAIRTYVTYWIEAGGRWECADVDATPITQKLWGRPATARSNRSVAATKGIVLTRNDKVFKTEYDNENGHRITGGIRDSVCKHRRRTGHGRGMCQRGSQRWADKHGKSHEWILRHYYPSADLVEWAPLEMQLGKIGALASR